MGKRGRDESIQAKVRAAVTLNSLNSEFRFLGKDTKSVLDLCAGSGWMQLAVARISKGGFVLGVDLHPVTPILGAISIQEDIATRECRDTIEKHMTENGFTGFDVVMRGGLSSDSCATTWDQASLLTKSIKLATKFLSPDGTFVTKMFDGAEDYNPMLYCLEQLFCRVVVTKPTSTSTKTYIVALNYKAPEKINPRLLVTRNLFSIKEEEEEEEKVVVLASDFVWSETPLEVLEKACSLSFADDDCLSLKDHSLTTKRIKRICKDLRVLNKRRFMHLMKWRLHVREALSHAQNADAKDGNKGNDDDDEIPDEMEYSEDIPKMYFSAETSTRIHGTTVMGVVVDDIDRGILIGTDGLLTGSKFRRR
ncbi:adoMet-dependent rRNA methyltransferase spb1-like [Papaver somniferum]|uniref:adoMet-dependent rRNA methyltransferase spb1-like n=1 Tax=Papaver somniferum TaxID=3469 RepID=UPI000E6FFD96|nr:adoMet-dependent rRNA methyltransferase spb1-like [Papaver somniferum]